MTDLSTETQLEILRNEFGHVYKEVQIDKNLTIKLYQSIGAKRLEGETFQEYKIRQKIVQAGIKHRQKKGIFA